MTTIGASVLIAGEVESDEDILIEGQVRGQVRVRNALLTIAEHARLDAEVRGTRILVRGGVKGHLSASERIELTPTAKVSGSLSANRVVIADGARFNGRVDMDQRTIAARVAQFKAAQAGV